MPTKDEAAAIERAVAATKRMIERAPLTIEELSEIDAEAERQRLLSQLGFERKP